MKFKYNKYIYIDIFENQLHSVIMINGKKIKINSIYKKLYLNILKNFNISLNIHIIKNKHFSYLNLINKSIEIMNKKKLIINKNNNDYKIKNNNNNKIINKKNNYLLKLFLNVFFFYPILIFIILIIIFLNDLKSIQIKINSNNLSEISKLKNDYLINHCETNKTLPALMKYCNNLEDKINLLKKKTPTLLSTFFIWIFDIFSSAIDAIGIVNYLLIFIILFLFIFIYNKIYKYLN